MIQRSILKQIFKAKAALHTHAKIKTASLLSRLFQLAQNPENPRSTAPVYIAPYEMNTASGYRKRAYMADLPARLGLMAELYTLHAAA